MARFSPTSAGRVFIDTPAYSAVTNRRDASHAAVAAWPRNLVAERRRLFTTNVILAELHALLLTRLDRFVAARVLAELDAGRVTSIVRVSARDEQRARAIIAQYTDEDFSLTAATSFAVMERLRISQAFSFDADFRQFGFVTLPERH